MPSAPRVPCTRAFPGVQRPIALVLPAKGALDPIPGASPPARRRLGLRNRPLPTNSPVPRHLNAPRVGGLPTRLVPVRLRHTLTDRSQRAARARCCHHSRCERPGGKAAQGGPRRCTRLGPLSQHPRAHRHPGLHRGCSASPGLHPRPPRRARARPSRHPPRAAQPQDPVAAPMNPVPGPRPAGRHHALARAAEGGSLQYPRLEPGGGRS